MLSSLKCIDHKGSPLQWQHFCLLLFEELEHMRFLWAQTSRIRRRLFKDGDSLQKFMKVPETFIGKAWHVAKSCGYLFLLFLKNRITHGCVGRLQKT